MNTDLVLNTGELREAATKFKKEADEMEIAITRAESTFSPCREHKSKRVSRRAEEWDEIKKAFKIKLEELLEASDKIVAAAVAFEGADDEGG